MWEGVVLRQRVIRGLNTAWLEAGPSDADIVLFLHGFPDNPASWRRQIDLFSRRYHVIAPYARGVYPSDKSNSPRRYGSDSVVLDLLEILSTFDRGHSMTVSVIGHDLGAVPAWKTAAMLGPRTKHLVIVNGLSVRQMARRLKWPRQLQKSWYIFFAQTPVLPDFALRRFSSQFLAYAKKCGRPSSGMSASSEFEDTIAGPLNHYRALFREVPAAMKTQAPRLRVPTLILWGREDPFLEPPKATEFTEDAESVVIRILPGGHWLHYSHADSVNGLIARFIEGDAEDAKRVFKPGF